MLIKKSKQDNIQLFITTLTSKFMFNITSVLKLIFNLFPYNHIIISLSCNRRRVFNRNVFRFILSCTASYKKKSLNHILGFNYCCVKFDTILQTNYKLNNVYDPQKALTSNLLYLGIFQQTFGRVLCDRFILTNSFARISTPVSTESTVVFCDAEATHTLDTVTCQQSTCVYCH